MVAPNDTINFIKKTLDSLPVPPKGKRYSFKDTREKGLIIRVTPTGQKTFQLYQKHQGRPVRVTLGNYPDISIENARKAAAKAKGEMASGTNPNVEKQRIRKEITLKELFQEYMDRYSRIEKRSWQYDEREINKFLSHWFSRKVSDISTNEIQKLHVKIREKNGLYQANRMLERLRSMYNKAIEWGWDGKNPTTGLKKFPEQSRDRFVQPDEMPLLLRALEQENNEVARDYIYISLFTGARKSNVLSMKWEQIDWKSQTWRIPDTKNGEPLTVPLSSRAEEILNQRLKANPGNPWVFPSDTSKEGHLADPKKAWIRIKQRATIELWRSNTALSPLVDKVYDAFSEDTDVGTVFKAIEKQADDEGLELPMGLMDIRIHDIRRTFGSYQAISGASLQIIGKSLGHKSQQSTQVYARLHNDPVRASIDSALDVMLATKNEK